jgi:hypothetical protein
MRKLLVPTLLLILLLALTAPASNVKTEVVLWKKYSLIAIANGVNGCANANGCWQVNGLLGANKAAGLTQDVTLFQLPATGKVTDWRMKTGVAVTGVTTANSGLGVTANNVLFRAASYDLKVAVASTNLVEGPTAGAGSGTGAATNVVASVVTTVDNVDQIVAGGRLDVWIQWSVLP